MAGAHEPDGVRDGGPGRQLIVSEIPVGQDEE